MMLGTIPETLEFEEGECIDARTASLATFRTLGPPDLIRLTKSAKGKENSTYFFATGIEVSSSAAVAAYLNTLTFNLGESQVWFGRHPQWKVSRGTYCCYNAFSRVDARVNAAIPGSVESFQVSPSGEQQQMSEHNWTEIYMSSMMRALLLKDADRHFVACCRHESFLQSVGDVDQFLEAFKTLFSSGPKVGASNAVQVATLENNFMVDALFQMLAITGEYSRAIVTLGEMYKFEPAVAVLLARAMLLNNDEVSAVQLMVKTIKEDPRNAPMLALEAQFCMDKKQFDLALDCAIRASTTSPVDFYVWKILTEVYIARGEYSDALLTLNTAPLQQSPPIDAHRMPQSKKVHLPLPTDGVIDEIWDVDANDDIDTADPMMLRLPASSLRGSSLEAFKLVLKIFKVLGWAELMALRGEVFLMEVEAASETKHTKHATVGAIGLSESADSPTTDATDNAENADTSAANAENASSAPSIENNETFPEAATEETEANRAAPKDIKRKRLCERRLDSLFMVLYEDVRMYSAWKREQVYRESQQMPFTKSALEWEMFGCIASRLGHEEQATTAFSKSLESRFSHRVSQKMLEFHLEKNQFMEALDYVVKLQAWNHRWYTEESPQLDIALRKIVAEKTYIMVKNQVVAKYGQTGASDTMLKLLKRLSTFGGSGFDSYN